MTNEALKEVIFVGLPGPTHNYGGLAPDNVAATTNRGSGSSPRLAALQALDLVRMLKSLGIEAGILPPQLRPHLPTLKQYFAGTPDEIITQAVIRNPELLEKTSSSSAMWVANALTTSAGPDNKDGVLHLTVANLHTNLHRRIEAHDTHRVIKAIFAKVPQCEVHAPLSAAQGLCDEGAANHMRLAPRHNRKALHVFVYGADGSSDDPPSARQSLLASQEIEKRHSIREAVFIKQNPDVIRQGVFHNDVIAVSNESVILVHEQAFVNGQADIERIADRYKEIFEETLNVITVTSDQLSVEEAVKTYFFNSQIVTKPDGNMALIAPTEVATLYGGKASRVLQNIVNDKSNPIGELHFVDLRQSMRNGGGPACLRLRVVMDEAQIAAVKQHVRVMADDKLLTNIESIIKRHYPEELNPGDIGDPKLFYICGTVLMELAALMGLPLLPE